jgi:hypothetical protein
MGNSIDLTPSLMLALAGFAESIHFVSDVVPDSPAVELDRRFEFDRSTLLRCPRIGRLQKVDWLYFRGLFGFDWTGFRWDSSIGGYLKVGDICVAQLFASDRFGSNHISDTFKSIDFGYEGGLQTFERKRSDPGATEERQVPSSASAGQT